MKKCMLPGCDKPARQKFCSNKHKDKYHNLYNPRRRAYFRSTQFHDYEYEESTHPFSGESLGQD
jgi:hypothetical protein